MREVRFEVDGESVAGKLYEPQGTPRGQLVLVHGMLSRSREFGELPTALAARGWRVLAVDQRGFGASGGPRGIITQERAIADTLAGVALLRKDQPRVPVAVLGHSMGAVFAAGALAADPTIKCGVLAAPMRTIRAEINGGEYAMYRVAHAVSRVTARTPLGPVRVPYKNTYDRLFYDEAAAAKAKEDPFLVSHVDLTNVPAFLAMDASANAKNVKQPVLVILADFDRAVKRKSSMAVYDALAGPKELATIACGHSMWADCEREKAIALVDDWLAKHLAA